MGRLVEVGALRSCVSTILDLEKLSVVDFESVYLLLGLGIEPLYALAFFPEAVLYAIFRANSIDSKAMLLALTPVSCVFSSVLPSVYTITMLFVFDVLALVGSAIVPKICADSVHVVLFPLTLIAPSIKPRVYPYAKDFVLKPLPRVLRAIIPLI